ncbi:BTAD domain-containing putative transcriptional regulator, partial [Streptomyces monticola]
MRFGVLGPLSVWRADGTPVRIPELKVRTLLADLLAHGGKSLAAHRLIDDLWGDALPVNPSGALHSKVSQLRRVLENAEPGARALVESRPPGYALTGAADAVDGDRFTALLARARATAELPLRRRLLDDALELWRGPAFADFAEEPFARAAISRLEENRLVALEERAETRIALGQHAEVVGELADLVVRHPLRERLRAAHLRALYGSGRRSEALAGYREVRELLADELGLDPGRDLAELHQAMLQQDPDLDAPRAPAAAEATEATEATEAATAAAATEAAEGGAPADAPAEVADAVRKMPRVPLPLTGLVGRADAVAEVRSLLAAHRLVTLTGPGGVGKTRLALETVRDLPVLHPREFPDGVRLVELSGQRRGGGCAAVAETVAAAVGVRDDLTWGPREGGGRATVTERLCGVLAPRSMLLVLDNCEHLAGPVAELADALLAAAPGLRILTTSQEPLSLAGEVLWTVPPLPLDDAVELFTARAAAAVPGYRPGPDDAEAVAAICRRLDGIPLVLELAATRVRALGVPELLARLDDRFRVLAGGYRGAPPRQQTLRAAMDWSWDLLDEPERIVLRRLAVHADGCSLRAAEAVCAGGEVAEEEVLGLLAALVDRSLVVVAKGPHGPRYRLLESVAAYCLERLREAGELDQVRLAHARHYSALAEQTTLSGTAPLPAELSEAPRLPAELSEAPRLPAELPEAPRLPAELPEAPRLPAELSEAPRLPAEQFCPIPAGQDSPLPTGRTGPLLPGQGSPPMAGHTSPLLTGQSTPPMAGQTGPLLPEQDSPTPAGRTSPLLTGQSTPPMAGQTGPLLPGQDSPTPAGRTSPLLTGQSTPPMA